MKDIVFIITVLVIIGVASIIITGVTDSAFFKYAVIAIIVGVFIYNLSSSTKNSNKKDSGEK